MEHRISFILPLIAFFACVNWSGQEANIDGSKKQKINFYGDLILRNGNTYKVENISIKYDYKKIVMYEMPGQSSIKDHKPGQEKSSMQPLRYITLSTNPKDGQREIDLSEVQAIKAPHPDDIYTYKPEKGSQREYLELVVVLNDPPQNTERRLLIEKNEPLRCDEQNAAGPQEAKYYFNTIVRLNIAGHRERIAKKIESGQTCEVVCKRPAQKTPVMANPEVSTKIEPTKIQPE